MRARDTRVQQPFRGALLAEIVDHDQAPPDETGRVGEHVEIVGTVGDDRPGAGARCDQRAAEPAPVLERPGTDVVGQQPAEQRRRDRRDRPPRPGPRAHRDRLTEQEADRHGEDDAAARQQHRSPEADADQHQHVEHRQHHQDHRRASIPARETEGRLRRDRDEGRRREGGRMSEPVGRGQHFFREDQHRQRGRGPHPFEAHGMGQPRREQHRARDDDRRSQSGREQHRPQAASPGPVARELGPQHQGGARGEEHRRVMHPRRGSGRHPEQHHAAPARREPCGPVGRGREPAHHDRLDELQQRVAARGFGEEDRQRIDAREERRPHRGARAEQATPQRPDDRHDQCRTKRREGPRGAGTGSERVHPGFQQQVVERRCRFRPRTGAEQESGRQLRPVDREDLVRPHRARLETDRAHHQRQRDHHHDGLERAARRTTPRDRHDVRDHPIGIHPRPRARARGLS